jgi:HK97 family phage portal protein
MWPADWAGSAGYSLPSPTGLTDPSETELRGLSAVHSAVSLIAGALSTTPWDVVQKLPSGGKRRITGIDAANAIAQFPIAEREAFLRDCLITGNGFAALRRNARGGVARIERITPERVSVTRIPDGRVVYRLAARADQYQNEEMLWAEDVLHLRYQISQNHPLLGASPLSSVAPSMDLVLQVRDSGRHLYRSAAMVNVALISQKQLSPEAATRLKQSVINATTGNERFRPLVLQENMRLETFEPASALNAALVEMSALSTKIVGQAYNVPSSMLGETDTISYSSSVEQARGFARFCLRPWSVKIGDCLSRALLPAESAYSVDVDTAQMTRGDGAELADVASKLVNGGIMSANECRDWFAMPDIEGGESLRLPLNTGPVDVWAQQQPDEPEPEPKKGWFK